MTVVDRVAVRASRRSSVGVAVGVGAACVGLALWNPDDHGTPLCPTKAITGLDCPLCGGLRAVASMTRGHALAAADHNVLVVALAPVVVVWWLLWWRAERRGRPMPRVRIPRAAWIGVISLAVVFTVVRNLDVGGVPGWLNSAAS